MPRVRPILFNLASLFLLVLFCAGSAFSQDPPTISQGMYPTATYFGSGFETVDMATFRDILHIPILSDKSQLGNLNFNYVVSSSGTGDWEASCYWYGFYYETCNWELTTAESGVPSGPSFAMDGAIQVGIDSGGNYLAYEGAGQTHTTASDGLSSSYFSLDGTGIQIQTASSPVAINNQGVQFLNSAYWTGSAPAVIDSNSNSMSLSPATSTPFGPSQFFPGNAWTMTDTVGRSWTLSVGDPSSLCPSTVIAGYAEVWTVPAFGGGTRDYVFCYRVPSAHTNFPDVTGGYGTTNNFGGPIIPSLSAVVLPDRTTWEFHYDDEGTATYYWGNLTEVKLPTGGTITYAWDMNIDYVNNSGPYYNNYLAQLTSRVTPDGTWSYSAATGYVGGGGTVTDPLGNATVASIGTGTNAIPGQIGEMDYYSGSATGYPIKKVMTDYEVITGPLPQFCWPTGLPIKTFTEYNNGGSSYVTSEVDRTYDSGFMAACGFYSPMNPVHYGQVTQVVNHDFGGAVLSVTNSSYKAPSDSTYLASNLLTLPSSQAITTATSGGYPCSETDYAYDSGTTGNLITVARQLFTNPCTSSASSATATNVRYTHDSQGRVTYSFDPLHVSTTPSGTYSYSGLHPYPTQVCNALSQCTTYTYDSNTEVMKSMTDPNSQTTNYPAYDCMLRLNEIDYPGYPTGGQETWTADYSGGTVCPSSGWLTYDGSDYTKKIDSSQTFTSHESDDTQGRPYQTQSSVPSATCSSGYAYVDIGYDEDGRQRSVSNSYCSTSDFTYGVTTTVYDPLSRPCVVYPQDTTPSSSQNCPSSQPSGTVYTSYNANCAVTSDEAVNTHVICFDGIGRQSGTIEDPYGSSYLTYYGYNQNGDMTSVIQEGTGGSSYYRNRTFTYDSLSRLTQAVDPESGATYYSYDNNGNLTYKQDARGVGTSYYYDALNRLGAKYYSDGTPEAAYNYDASSWSGISLSNTIGRMYSAGTFDGTTWTTSEAFSYDQMGRVSMNIQCRVSGCVKPDYGYNYAGGIKSYDYVPYYLYSGSTVAISQDPLDVDNRVTHITSSLSDSSHPSTLVSGVYYWPAGSLKQMTSINGVIESVLDEPRLQPCRITFYLSGTPPAGCDDSVPGGNIQDFHYTFGSWGSTNNSNVTNWTGTGHQNFGRAYDYIGTYTSTEHLNRITSMRVSTGDPFCGYNWTYDAWGNRTAQTPVSGSGCYSWSSGYTSANQMSSGFSYDAAGNLTADGSHTYFYDAENRLIQVDGTLGTCSTAAACYVYDAEGRRVQKILGTDTTEYFYDLDEHVLTEVDDGLAAWQTGHIYLNGQTVAEYVGGSSGTTQFVHTDHLGSTRLVTDLSASVCESIDYMPFGEAYVTGSCDTTHKFTGKERDSESGLDNFGARYMSSQYGRFMSPDPSGGHFINPQSLNRYAYVHNNPLNLIDPTGRDCVYTDNLDSDGTVTVQRGDCTSDTDNGIFVNGTIDTNSFNLTQDQNGDLSLGFGYTNDDTGNFSLFSTNLPGMSGFNNTFGSGFGFGSPQYASQLFSQVYQNTRAVTNPKNIAAFYGASAATGFLATELGPAAAAKLAQIPGALESLEELGTQLAYNPQFTEFVTDFIQGYTPGAVPATLGGLAGFAASEIQSHLSQISQGLQNTYQQVKGSVPH